MTPSVEKIAATRLHWDMNPAAPDIEEQVKKAINWIEVSLCKLDIIENKLLFTEDSTNSLLALHKAYDWLKEAQNQLRPILIQFRVGQTVWLGGQRVLIEELNDKEAKVWTGQGELSVEIELLSREQPSGWQRTGPEYVDGLPTH